MEGVHANMEHHVVQTQLEGVCKGLEIMNIEHCLVRTQLEGICQGVVRPETQEAVMGTTKVAVEPRLNDKGKGKEIVNEETLQEEPEQQNL